MKKIIFIAFCISIITGVIIFKFTPTKTKIISHYSILSLSKSDLIGSSDIIIRGTVKEILPSVWSNPGFKKGNSIRNILTTDIVIEIKKIFKGIPYDNKNIIVRIEKGYDDSTTAISDGYPDFKPEENVILFLSNDESDIVDTSSNYYVLTGMAQGKFALKKSTIKDEEYSSEAEWLKENIFVSKFSKEIEQTMKVYKKLDAKAKEEIRLNNEKLFGK
jgi:hypothetical protein